MIDTCRRCLGHGTYEGSDCRTCGGTGTRPTPYTHNPVTATINVPDAPKRIQMTRQRPWRADNPDAVIVDRTTRWGNPVKVCPGPGTSGVDCRCEDECTSTAEDAVTRYRHFLLYPCTGQPRVPDLDELRYQLGGRDLACWCPLNQPCHADVLLELANAPAPQSPPERNKP